MADAWHVLGTLTAQIYRGKVLSINNINNFQTRGESSARMILDAVKIFPANEGIPDQTIILHSDDFPQTDVLPDGSFLPNHYYYACDNPAQLNQVFPDFAFESWPQVGIHSYTETVNEIMAKSRIPYQSNKLFWIGAMTHASRLRFMEIAQTRPDLIDAVNTQAHRHFIEGEQPVRYVSLPEHTEYKYLIDIEGHGWSARLKYLLFTQRVLFIQERRWKQYYLYELEPYKHFIPVKNDLSDLIQQIEFVEKEGETFYNYISNNAFAYAMNNLQYEHAIKRIRKLISQSVSQSVSRLIYTLKTRKCGNFYLN